MEFREAIARDAEDLRSLAESIVGLGHADAGCGLELLAGLAVCGDSFRDQERRLDAAALRLRQDWLRIAHRPADITLKSPCDGQHGHLASGRTVEFGYERDLDVSVLEARGANYMVPIKGRAAELVLFRSGQAALTALIQLAVERWGADAPLRVTYDGAYFETQALLGRWPARVLRPAQCTADILIGEPVWCDGGFSRAVPPPASITSLAKAVILDTTLSGRAFDASPWLSPGCGPLFVVSSGLKLDQGGLELANVGMVRIYAQDTDTVAARLRKLRALNGTGLTLDELSTLSAPWFMDRQYADRYTSAVFSNNRALAQAIGTASPVFEADCHPSLLEPGLQAPFCALRLRAPSPANYKRLLDRFETEIQRRGLLAAKGGSFGFRGHRYELIEPEPDQGRTFLRVAMGWRDGFSRQGLTDLLAEIAAEHH
jgi:hypothetical protein